MAGLRVREKGESDDNERKGLSERRGEKIYDDDDYNDNDDSGG
jgi:hypothetical protein